MYEPSNVNVRFHDGIIQFLHPNTGTEIDSYILDKNIAKSNEWWVWKGKRYSNNEQAAIKSIKIPPCHPLHTAAMNELKINVWAQTERPIGLQQVLGCFVDPIQGIYCCVAKLYPTYDRILANLHPGQAGLSLLKLAATLHTLQSKYRFMHRDLHLGNVLYDPVKEIPILTDFGNAFVGTIPLQCDDNTTYRPASVKIFNQQHDLRLFVVALWEYIRSIDTQNDTDRYLTSVLTTILNEGRKQSPIFEICFDDEFVTDVCRDYQHPPDELDPTNTNHKSRAVMFRDRHERSLSLWKETQDTPKISVRNLMYDGLINCKETTCFVPAIFGQLLGFMLSTQYTYEDLAPYMEPFIQNENHCSLSLVHKSCDL